MDGLLTIHTVEGAVTLDQAMNSLKTFYAGQASLHVLWDFTDGTLGELSGAQVQSIAEYVSRAAKNRHGGKTAGVASKDVDYGLGRMFQAFTEMMKYTPTMRLFRQREDALAWLREDEAISACAAQGGAIASPG